MVEFPGSHELAGPPGTLIGLSDLTDKVITAIDEGIETQIAGSFRWPPAGVFISQTFRQKPNGPLAKYLNKDWNDPEQTWFATIYWGKADQNWFSSASMGLSLWRSLRPALRRLLENDEVRELEARAGLPVG